MTLTKGTNKMLHNAQTGMTENKEPKAQSTCDLKKFLANQLESAEASGHHGSTIPLGWIRATILKIETQEQQLEALRNETPSRSEILSLEDSVRSLEAKLSQTLAEAHAIQAERNALKEVVKMQMTEVAPIMAGALEMRKGMQLLVESLAREVTALRSRLALENMTKQADKAAQSGTLGR